MPHHPLTVGFDLDMTLVDSRAGVREAYLRLSERTGTPIDADAAVARLGPPLEREIARWFPAWEVAAAVSGYREIYATTCRTGTVPLPGAAESLAAVRAAGGRVVVVTAKAPALAEACLDAAGLSADAVVGLRWGTGKGEALAEHGATAFVGDHLGDVEGARAAGATAVAVATGPVPADRLRAAGADVVLGSLAEFPAWLDDHRTLPERLAALEGQLRSLGTVCVALSGGADSAFLLAAAVRALGADRVLAATAVSGSLASTELAGAEQLAGSLGVRHIAVPTREIEREGYRANAGDRCYFCKAELLDVLGPLAREAGLAAVATGTNADDAVAGFRPGIKAAAERGAATPLLDAGLTKRQVRAASRAWGLPTWDKPAAACLSSRVAYGVAITPRRLARIDGAELALRGALSAAGIPVQNVRVRDLGDVARVEVDRELVAAVAARPEVLGAVQGFAEVELDPRGFRTGSMNERLPDPELYR
ncbi:MAG: ATP-dependent sacrificial sulfur transferase LarE [Frankiaceae bacterium]